MPTKPFYLKLQYHRCSQTTDLYKHTLQIWSLGAQIHPSTLTHITKHYTLIGIRSLKRILLTDLTELTLYRNSDSPMQENLKILWEVKTINKSNFIHWRFKNVGYQAWFLRQYHPEYKNWAWSFISNLYDSFFFFFIQLQEMGTEAFRLKDTKAT